MNNSDQSSADSLVDLFIDIFGTIIGVLIILVGAPVLFFICIKVCLWVFTTLNRIWPI